MGAGSTVFAKNVIGDSMCCEALRDFEFALYDIDAERLEESYIMVTALNKNINQNRAKISKYLGVSQRKDALRGADFVVDAIQVGLYRIIFQILRFSWMTVTAVLTLIIVPVFSRCLQRSKQVVLVRSSPKTCRDLDETLR